MKNLLTEKAGIRLLKLGVSLLLISFVLFLWNDFSLSFYESLNSEKIGSFGDLVGGLIGSIWALAGVILFYVALTEQRSDFKTNRKVLEAQTDALNLQIKEFELQRNELSETRKVFSIQSETLKKQQFESTFFNLLNLHHQIVNSIDLNSNNFKYNQIERMLHTELSEEQKKEKVNINTTGRDCFVKFSKGFRNKYYKLKKNNEGLGEKQICKNSYLEYYSKHQSDLGHYFRNLYQIIKFIKNSEVKNKRRYTSLVRAQLSNDELFLLFYNGISELGNDKFKPLIEEYHLLKNLNRKFFIEPNEHTKFYKESAYK